MLKKLLDDDNVKLGQTILKDSLITLMPNGETRLSFLTFLSKGEFNIDLSDVSFNDVYLLQQNYHSMNLICSIASFAASKIGKDDYIKGLCNNRCINGTTLNMANLDLPEAATKNISKDSWCYSKICSSKDINKCISHIDPTRPACIWAPDQYGNNTNNPVSYKLVTPMLSHQISFTYWLNLILDFNKKLYLNSFNLDKETIEMIDRNVENLGIALDSIAGYIPLHLAKLIVGSYIFYVAHDMTSSSFTRYLIAILIGFAFALILVFYVVYQNGDNIRKKIPLFGQSLISLGLLGYVWIYGIQQNLINTFLSYGIDNAWNFYENGALGFSLLGKVFYSMSILSSIWSTWYWGFFKPNAVSGKLIYFGVKILAIMFLLDGTPNQDFSLLLLILVYFWDDIRYFFFRVKMFFETTTQTPTYKYIPGGRISRQEYEDQTKSFTEIQLEQLRRTYQTNKEYREIAERSPYRDTKVLINRFISRNYWLPIPPHEEEIEPTFSYFRFISYIIIIMTVLAGFVYVCLKFAGIEIFSQF